MITESSDLLRLHEIWDLTLLLFLTLTHCIRDKPEPHRLEGGTRLPADAHWKGSCHRSSFYDPSFHDSTTILTYSPYPFSYDSSYDTRLWERRKQQDVYWDPTDNKAVYASRTPDQSRHTWPSPPGFSPRQPPRRPGQPDDPTLV